jgi:hypothetical protein
MQQLLTTITVIPYANLNGKAMKSDSASAKPAAETVHIVGNTWSEEELQGFAAKLRELAAIEPTIKPIEGKEDKITGISKTAMVQELWLRGVEKTSRVIIHV